MPVIKIPTDSLRGGNQQAFQPHTATPDPVLDAASQVMEAAGNRLTSLQDQAIKTATELKATLAKVAAVSKALELMMLNAESLMMLALRAKTGATAETRQLATNALIEAALNLEAPEIDGVTR